MTAYTQSQVNRLRKAFQIGANAWVTVRGAVREYCVDRLITDRGYFIVLGLAGDRGTIGLDPADIVLVRTTTPLREREESDA